MKKPSSVFILLLIFINTSVNAQSLDSLYRNDHLKINGKQNTELMYHLASNLDYDSVSWIGIDSLVFYGGNSLDIAGYTIGFNNKTLEKIDSINGYAFQYKYNNKLYRLDNNFVCCNLNRDHSITQTHIFDLNGSLSKCSLNIKSIFSKEKEFFLLYRQDVNPYNKTYIYVVDTLGNILRSDSIERYAGTFKLTEQGNNILFSTYSFFDVPESQLYLVNKQSLKIVDSISNSDYLDGEIISINDSIIIAESVGRLNQGGTNPACHSIFKINTITHDINTLISNIITQSLALCYPGYDENRITYRSLDSIYLCFSTQLPDYYPDSLVRICIANFNISGILNYTYNVDFNIGEQQKIIRNIEVTNDGGLLIAVSSRRYFPVPWSETWTSYIIKFMPNGYSSITNVETQEKESIKVYPNPARDYVNVDIECTNFKASDIELIDMQGRTVKQAKLKSRQGNRIDVSSLIYGAYTYNVSLNGKTISGKIIIGK